MKPLLILNKDISGIMQKQIYLQLTIKNDQNRQLRLNLWFQILEVEKGPEM